MFRRVFYQQQFVTAAATSPLGDPRFSWIQTPFLKGARLNYAKMTVQAMRVAPLNFKLNKSAIASKTSLSTKTKPACATLRAAFDGMLHFTPGNTILSAHPFSNSPRVSPSGKPQTVFTRRARRSVEWAPTAGWRGGCTCGPTEENGAVGKHGGSRE